MRVLRCFLSYVILRFVWRNRQLLAAGWPWPAHSHVGNKQEYRQNCENINMILLRDIHRTNKHQIYSRLHM